TAITYLCVQVVSRAASGLLSAHYRVDSHPHINSLHEVLLGEQFLYLVFPPAHGDLHSHVRLRKRLREPEARRLFKQIAETVRACHDQGIVLRDLKLRKFVFADPHRNHLKLETLEDAVVLEDPDDDHLQDKRGCPAYVSPEILRSHARYSGRAADMWSLGIILYTMLVGRYPFNASEHASLFAKITRGHFIIPDCLSSRAKCLIRSLLRREPSERLSAADVLLHPWLARE
ncbi:Tribbles-like protein 2, partial [Zootermopsis nevadensis]